MFDMVDTAFSYGRGLIVCSSLQEFSKTKESTLHVIWNVDTFYYVFTLLGRFVVIIILIHLYHVWVFCTYQIRNVCKTFKLFFYVTFLIFFCSILPISKKILKTFSFQFECLKKCPWVGLWGKVITFCYNRYDLWTKSCSRKPTFPRMYFNKIWLKVSRSSIRCRSDVIIGLNFPGDGSKLFNWPTVSIWMSRAITH